MGIRFRAERMIAGQIVAAVLVAVVWAQWRPSWPYLLIAPCLAFLLAVLTIRTGFATTRARRWFRGKTYGRERPVEVERGRWFDIELAEHRVGVSFDGDDLAAVVELRGRPKPTVLTSKSTFTEDLVPMDQVFGLLDNEFAEVVDLEAIELMSRGQRSHLSSLGWAYSRLVGRRGAVAKRRTVLVLRARADLNLGAAAAYGGGGDGLARAMAVRAVTACQTLQGENFRARVLTAAEIVTLGDQSAAGLAGAHEELSASKLAGGGFATCFEFAGDQWQTANIDQWWSVPSLTTTITARIQRVGSSIAGVHGVVRFDTRDRFAEQAPAGLEPIMGWQGAAVAASVLDASPLTISQYSTVRGDVSIDEVCGVKIPIGDSGQMMGVTADGHSLLVPLADPAARGGYSVDVRGSELLGQQTVLRAVATGERVHVVTATPQKWAFMQQSAKAQTLTVGRQNPSALPTLAVFDQVPAQPVPDGVSVMTLRRPADRPIDANVTITQAGSRVIVVSTEYTGEVSLSSDMPNEERVYLVDPAAARQTAPAPAPGPPDPVPPAPSSARRRRPAAAWRCA